MRIISGKIATNGGEGSRQKAKGFPIFWDELQFSASVIRFRFANNYSTSRISEPFLPSAGPSASAFKLPENKTAPVMIPNGCNQAVCFQSNDPLVFQSLLSKRWLPVTKFILGFYYRYQPYGV